MPDANAKARSAMSAYSPVAIRVFGSHRISQDLKVALFWSLILSKLLFNIHVVVVGPRYLRALNAVYMRALRRIGGHCNYGDSTISDINVRRKLQMPSLDCLMVRARLRYLGRLLRTMPPALLALLACRFGGKRLPWTEQLVQDLRIAHQQVALCSRLPDPSAGAQD